MLLVTAETCRGSSDPLHAVIQSVQSADSMYVVGEDGLCYCRCVYSAAQTALVVYGTEKVSFDHHLAYLFRLIEFRSGKSSIINCVLYKLPPTETVFIPTTILIKKHRLQYVLGVYRPKLMATT
jgi:hypothetical protein